MGPADPELVLHSMSVALLVEPESWRGAEGGARGAGSGEGGASAAQRALLPAPERARGSDKAAVAGATKKAKAGKGGA